MAIMLLLYYNQVRSSFFQLSNDNILRKLLNALTLIRLRVHVLGKVNQSSSFLLDQKQNAILDCLIKVTHLGNHDVDEYQGGEVEDQDPECTVYNVLSLAEGIRAVLSFQYSEFKVTEGQSDGSQVVTGELFNLLVFLVCWRYKEAENHGEHGYDNDKEENENPKVITNSSDHGNYETEALEDLHVEEGLYQAEKDVENQEKEGCGLFWYYKNLNKAAIVSDNRM